MLEAAVSMNTPIILQGSLNALGQSESDNGKLVNGYLKSNKGAQDLVEAALNAGTDYILISEEKTNIDNHNFVDIKSYFSLIEALDIIKAKLS